MEEIMVEGELIRTHKAKSGHEIVAIKIEMKDKGKLSLGRVKVVQK